MILDNIIREAQGATRDRGVILTGRTTVLGDRVVFEMRRAHADGVAGYSFEVMYRGERAICMVACGQRQAREIFFALLRGRVTPCSFAYVMQEITEPGALVDRISPKNKILC